MNKLVKKMIAGSMGVIAMASLTGCGEVNNVIPEKSADVDTDKTTSENLIEDLSSEVDESESSKSVQIVLNKDSGTVDGTAIEEFDYTWNCDPTEVHDDVENAPAEYYTGTKADSDLAVYIDHELYYYPILDEASFTKVRYDGEEEWAYYYCDGVNDEFIFATLPSQGNQLPTQMMHSADEAAANKVLHITKPGEYVLSGEWTGQVYVDCGEDASDSEAAKVTLILDNVNITCTVAPGIIFKNVYECDGDWESSERTDATVDTSLAGANIIIADDSTNYISGQNVYRMLKTKYKDETSNSDVKLQKKMRKTDGALYSYMTMNIDGEEKGNGTLTIDSSYEGIGSELHLNIKGGNITINAQDDGINANEDHVSVIVLSGGELTINPALGNEGDGIDSNGYILVDGGNIYVNGVRVPDSALDAGDGTYYESGKVVVDGEEQSYEAGSVIKDTIGQGGGHGFMGGQKQDGEKPAWGQNGEKPNFNQDGLSDTKPENEEIADTKPDSGEVPDFKLDGEEMPGFKTDGGEMPGFKPDGEEMPGFKPDGREKPDFGPDEAL